MFVTEAQTDKVQLEAHDWLPSAAKDKPIKSYYAAYMDEWRKNQSDAFRTELKKSDGYFNPACFIHTGFSREGPTIRGTSFVDAFNMWLAGSAVRLADDCGLLCGTLCEP